MELKSLISIGKLLSVCVSLAAEGGRIIREVHTSGKLLTTFKGYDDPCTQADLSVQKLYSLGLNTYFPGIKIIGEENVAEAAKMVINEEAIMERVKAAATLIEQRPVNAPYKVAWDHEVDMKKLNIWVDPLDGTKEYTMGNLAYVTSLIGITIDNMPEYGVIHKPFMDHDLNKSATYFGGKGVGVLMYSESGFTEVVKSDEASRHGFTLLTSKSHYSKAIERIIGVLKPDEIKRMGGAGNKVLGVLKGEGDCYLYPSYGLKPWDTCAGEALINEMGGWLADCHGERINYTKPYAIKGVVCARSKELVDRIVAALKDVPEIMKL